MRLSMKITQVVSNGIINQKLITFTPEALVALGIKHHAPISVETPDGIIKTTLEFGPVRFGRRRTAIAAALGLKLGDKLIAEFQEDGTSVKLTPVHNVPDPAAMKEFDNPHKAQTRQKVWETIAKDLPVKPGDALVLYLAGINDLDRAVALKLGFKANNLIAVERDDTVFAELRYRKKLLVIHNDISATLNAWTDKPVNVVYADFSCGWYGGSRSLLNPLVTNSAFNDCIVAVNMLRGRDEVNTVEGRTHRGLTVWDSVGKTLLKELKHYIRNEQYALSLLTTAIKRTQVTYRTYRSDHQTFDTVIWKNITIPNLIKDVDGITVRSTRLVPQINQKLRHEIRAVLATRTRLARG